ncbi:MAG: hypothetical protein AAGA59_15090 [Actinomycetota bacterium]
MNRTSDILEERAERGHPRGDRAVWSAAVAESRFADEAVGRRPATVFRITVAAVAVALVAIGVVGLGRIVATDDDAALSAAEPGDDIDDGLPAPILIDGGRLGPRGVQRPLGADVDGVEMRTGPEDTASVVFADPADPFAATIVGLDLLEGGGFRPWGANLSDAPLEDTTRHAALTENGWGLSPESGLVEVARIESSTLDQLRFGWQFDFELGGGDRVTLQAEPVESPGVGEWLWISRVAQSAPSSPTVMAVPVLDTTGYVVTVPGQDGDEGVIWSDDAFVYRLTADRIEDDTAVPVDTTAHLDRLRLVDRGTWNEEVSAASQRGAGFSLSGLLVLLAILASLVFFVWHRLRWPAALLGFAIVTLVVWGSVPLRAGPVVFAAVVLAASWALHRRRWFSPRQGRLDPEHDGGDDRASSPGAAGHERR